MSKHTPGAVCNICKTPFDTGLHADCGGDCLMCMAEAGDTDCALTAVTHLKAQRDALLEANEAFGKRQEWWNERMVALEQQRDALLEALKSTGLFLHHCWCDVQMNDYSFEKMNQQMQIVDAAIAKAEGEEA
jgi:hypothetical protein